MKNYVTLLTFFLLATSMNNFAKSNSETRPWGHYEIIQESPQYKIKKIVVLPGKRLSLQRHQFRSEHWTIIEGTGLVTLNDQQITVSGGSTIHVGLNDIHRVHNTGTQNLVFIEIQTGTYFGEDDIERLEDDYGRISQP